MKLVDRRLEFDRNSTKFLLEKKKKKKKKKKIKKIATCRPAAAGKNLMLKELHIIPRVTLAELSQKRQGARWGELPHLYPVCRHQRH